MAKADHCGGGDRYLIINIQSLWPREWHVASRIELTQHTKHSQNKTIDNHMLCWTNLTRHLCSVHSLGHFSKILGILNSNFVTNRSIYTFWALFKEKTF